MHGERDLVLARQGVDNAVHLFQVVCAFGTFESSVARQVQVVEVVGLVNERLVAHYFAVVVYEDIAHDGVYPSFEVGVGRVFIFVVQGFQRGFLKQVVGFFAVGSELICKA